MIEKDDWRICNQIQYLYQKPLSLCDYTQRSEKWDHDHCEFCWKTFSIYDGDLKRGYCTSNKQRWVCEECYEDFHEMFEWPIVPCQD